MAEHKVQNPDFRAGVREIFARQGIMQTMQVDVTVVEPGHVEIEFPWSNDVCQQNGFLHAGIVATAIDSCCGCAAYTLMPPGASVLAVEFKSNFCAPAQGNRFRAIGTVRKPGRTITVVEGELLALRDDGSEKLVAVMQGTMMTIQGRPDL